MTHTIKLINKTELLEFDSPLAEPNIITNQPYRTHREARINGDIVWFGIAVNWRKEPNKSWEVLGHENGKKIWIPCEPPIYETLYQQMLKNENNPKNGAWLYENALKEAKQHNLGEE